jgi:hypothetical protein
MWSSRGGLFILGISIFSPVDWAKNIGFGLIVLSVTINIVPNGRGISPGKLLSAGHCTPNEPEKQKKQTHNNPHEPFFGSVVTRKAADYRANQTNESQRDDGSPATTAHEYYYNAYQSAEPSRWLWLSLLPFGLGSWVPVVAGLRCGARYGTALGVLVKARTCRVVRGTECWHIRRTVFCAGHGGMCGRGCHYVCAAVQIRTLDRVRSAFDLPAPRPDRRARWPWLSLLPLGLGAWAPMRRWTVLGVLWSALALAGWIVAGASSQGSQTENLAGALFVLSWVGGFITSFVIRPSYERRVDEYVSERALWPGPTARSREWTVRYALIAYVVTLVVVVAVAAVLDYGAGVRLHIGVGVLMVDVILLGSLVPLKRRRGLTHRDLGLRAVLAARSVGLVIVALIAYKAAFGVIACLLYERTAARCFQELACIRSWTPVQSMCRSQAMI